MKTTVDIPEKALEEAIRFSGATTKRGAILAAIEEFNRRKRAEQFLVKAAGSFSDLPRHEEIEAMDMEREERIRALWNGKKMP